MHVYRSGGRVRFMAGDGIRRKRIGGSIRKHLSAELSREVADPRLFSLSVQEVDVSGDLSLARVSVRLMFGGESDEARRGAMAALRAVAPGLRSSLAPVLRMRRVPELRFEYDQGADQRAEIESVLAEIKEEDEAKRSRLTDQQGGESPAGD